jgi:hypothetical protein
MTLLPSFLEAQLATLPTDVGRMELEEKISNVIAEFGVRKVQADFTRLFPTQMSRGHGESVEPFPNPSNVRVYPGMESSNSERNDHEIRAQIFFPMKQAFTMIPFANAY